MRVAFATCRDLPRLIDEDRQVAAHLDDHGLRVLAVCWDDPGVDWRSFDAVVIRSCWDYHVRPGEFVAWLEKLAAQGCTVWNPVPLMLWNRDKTYLRELRARGVDTVPTVFLDAGSPADLGELMARLAADELVVKPTIAASSHGLWVVSANDADGQARLDEALRTDALMVQPLIGEIREAGEWSLMYFAGELSHAVNKLPKAGDIRVQEELGGRTSPADPPPTLVTAARRVLASIDGPILYARIDLVEIDGRGVLMELELIEPMLYFEHAPGSPENFRRALVKVMGRAQ